MKTIAKRCALMICAAVAMFAAMGPALAQTPGKDAEGCGWYVILGCARDANVAFDTLAKLGGHGVGGGAGANVLDTRFIGNFNPGYFCVADGPYISQSEASSVAWVEAVRDAYVKRGC